MDIDEIMHRVDDYARACEYNLHQVNSINREIRDAIEAFGWIEVTRRNDGTYGPTPEVDRWIVWINNNADVTGTEPIANLILFSDPFNEGLGSNVLFWRYVDPPAHLDEVVLSRRRELALGES
jgi:hypothetical protein